MVNPIWKLSEASTWDLARMSCISGTEHHAVRPSPWALGDVEQADLVAVDIVRSSTPRTTLKIAGGADAQCQGTTTVTAVP